MSSKLYAQAGQGGGHGGPAGDARRGRIGSVRRRLEQKEGGDGAVDADFEVVK